jgi:glutathione S-transferase
MNPTITAFANSPDRGQGLARDMRVRWALEEVGQPYDVRLLSFAEMKEPAHMALHPFGQIPTYEEGALALFETGAIVFHIAQRHSGLLPEEPDARARAIAWMFAALNTMEPPIVDLSVALFLEGDKPWTAERLPLIHERIRTRLAQLSAHLGPAEWLDGGFSAADLLMVTVLHRAESSGLLEEAPNVQAYIARGKARPAYRKALPISWRCSRKRHKPAAEPQRVSTSTASGPLRPLAIRARSCWSGTRSASPPRRTVSMWTKMSSSWSPSPSRLRKP